jgi:hypothetical protein
MGPEEEEIPGPGESCSPIGSPIRNIHNQQFSKILFTSFVFSNYHKHRMFEET